jgi:hypothetical protein
MTSTAKARALSKDDVAALRERFAGDPEVTALIAAYQRGESLLRRSLWEFGSELRGEIEAYLNEPPLLGRR